MYIAICMGCCCLLVVTCTIVSCPEYMVLQKTVVVDMDSVLALSFGMLSLPLYVW